VAVSGLEKSECPVRVRDGFRIHGQDALILIRPDGYIGLIADPDNALAVAGYLRSL
jgi:hypothetical protein